MKPTYTRGEPVGLHHILHDWLKTKDLPVELMWNSEEQLWFLIGENWLTASLEDQVVDGWQPEFLLNAADPEFFDKLEATILDAEDVKNNA